MVLTIIISILTCVTLISSILFKPTVYINKKRFDTFWMIALIGAILILVTKCLPLNILVSNLTVASAINPLKIIILLLSLTMLSITLDEVGFFEFVATKAVKCVNGSQYKLFFIFYILTAVLTVFTSNDIVILTFTLFICYFSKNAKISPIPYLVMEFVTANTYSMLFIIGNPTNIYISSVFDISFLEYLKVMWLPTILAGLTSLGLLLLLFRKQLSTKMSDEGVEVMPIKHKRLAIVALVHLLSCTILLAISNYVNLEMWIITLCFAGSLTIVLGAYSIVRKSLRTISHVYKRLPYTLCLFVLSMYVIVLALDYHEVTLSFANLIDSFATTKFATAFTYGFASTISDNLINNIPMSLAYASVLANANINPLVAIFATIIGSNIGAYLTPIGALAGIMWMRILKEEKVDFTFKAFSTYGVILTIPVLIMALLGLIILM